MLFSGVLFGLSFMLWTTGYLNFDYIFRAAGGAIAQMFFITNDVFCNDGLLGGAQYSITTNNTFENWLV